MTACRVRWLFCCKVQNNVKNIATAYSVTNKEVDNNPFTFSRFAHSNNCDVIVKSLDEE